MIVVRDMAVGPNQPIKTTSERTKDSAFKEASEPSQAIYQSFWFLVTGKNLRKGTASWTG